LLGLGITIYWAQQHPAIQQLIKNRLCSLPAFEHAYIDCNVEKINFFFPRIELGTINAACKHNDWHWQAENITLTFSWLDFLLTKKIRVTIVINQAQACCAVDQDFPLLAHIKKLLEDQQSSLPIELYEIIFIHSSLAIHQVSTNIDYAVAWDSHSKQMQGILKSTLHFIDGSIKQDSTTYIEHFNGTMHCTLPYIAPCPYSMDINSTLTIPWLETDNKECFLTGNWRANEGNFKITQLDGLIVIDPCTISVDNSGIKTSVQGSLPLRYVAQLAPQLYQNFITESQCTFRLATTINTQGVHTQGTVTINTIGIPQSSLYKIDALTSSFERNSQGIWSGIVDIHKKNFLSLQGNWEFNEAANNGLLACSNTMPLTIGHDAWTVQPDALHVKATLSHQNVEASYTCAAQYAKHEDVLQTSGTLISDGHTLQLDGNVGAYVYNATCLLKPWLMLNNFTCTDQEGAEYICIKPTSQNGAALQAVIDYQFIHALLPPPLCDLFAGKGNLTIEGDIDDNGTLHGTLCLSKGDIVLPYIYNTLQDIKGSITIERNGILTLRDVHIILAKGEMNCSKAVFYLQDLSHATFIHCPVTIKKCFVRYQKEIIGSFSGSIVVEQHSPLEPPFLWGALVLERGTITAVSEQLLNSIASNRTFPSWSTQAKIHACITTKHPIKIKTGTLESQATCSLSVQGNLLKPALTGTIDLHEGSIQLPYKPLSISHAKLHFVSPDTYDPLLDITAKNSIKRYAITMHITGSASNPHIMLESSPSLSEEQICSLLLAGSEHASLTVAAQTLLMQNIQQLLSSVKNNPFDRLFQPFKNIKIVPSLHDDKSTGMHGGIEIDINDRLHAIIQKNLNTADDPKVEVDYVVTDDINIRGIKDEHGDVAGEIEMRWRF